MTLIEDMDTLLSGESKTQEQSALSMLDGQNQVNGVVHIATTNYPEKLEDRFIKRPGRFDLVIGMDLPIEITRRAYFQQILKDDCHPELEFLVDKTEGMALAYLREIASSYLCLGIPIEETLVRLRKNLNTTLKTSKGYGKSSLGFTVGYEGKEQS
jgi:SpoVK/Ycf46/Vps4 family AAA+-type ATPase